jgi:hypothetical protein
MKGLFQTADAILVFGMLSCAQSTEPIPAPTDLILQLSTEGGQHQFRLGELIPIKYSYSAEISGKYMLVSPGQKLAGGHDLEISCSPPGERVSQRLTSPEFERFEEMLDAPCDQNGVGAGSGGTCGDCDTDFPLSTTAVSFGTVPLNKDIRFSQPGTYTCVASAADVTMAQRDEKVRAALLVKSNPVVLTIIDDPAWARSSNIAYADAYDQLCRGDNVAQTRFLQCSDLAQRVTYLDTIDSLATEVKFYDGKNHGWDNGFGDAIQRSSCPNEALRLLTSRIQAPDVQVSRETLESLAIWDLRNDSPDAFLNASPANHHSSAVENLRKYVRLLGSSLSNKNPDVLLESAKTYRTFAEQEYCERRPLIPREERIQMLSALGHRP